MGNIVVLSAPSGAGKTTIGIKLLEELKNLKRVVTITTRQKRPGETDGVDYFFVSKEDFEEKIKANELIEYANVYGNYYGTPVQGVKHILDEGKDALLIIDIQGAKKVKEIFPYALLIFLMPPSFEELVSRFKNRGFEDENASKRLAIAREEIACAKYFDFIVVNRYVDETIETIKSIIFCNKARKDYFLTHKENVSDDIINLLGGKCDVFET